MRFLDFINESEEWMLYNITNPENLYIRGTGFQGKTPIKSAIEARKLTPRDGVDGWDKDYIAIKVKDFEKKFKIKLPELGM